MAVMVAAVVECKMNFGLEISWLKYTLEKGYIGIVEWGRGQMKDRHRYVYVNTHRRKHVQM